MRFPTSVARDPAIEVWLREHPGELGAIARRWFEVMRACGDDVRELLHDGHPTACVGDAAFADVNAFTAHVNVGFFRGAELADPDGLLQGTGRFMRHVKLRPERDVDAAALRTLIERAYDDMRARLSTGEIAHAIEIRDEQPDDAGAVREVHRQAFTSDEEGRIVDALRENGGVLLSMVAVADGTVVGHILFSPATVGPVAGAALGPMAVRPPYQRHGIGGQLVERGVERLRNGGCPFIVVIGHPRFYPRFGFQPAASCGLTCDWDVPADAFMVRLLNPEVGRRLIGRARYRPEFSAGR